MWGMCSDAESDVGGLFLMSISALSVCVLTHLMPLFLSSTDYEAREIPPTCFKAFMIRGLIRRVLGSVGVMDKIVALSVLYGQVLVALPFPTSIIIQRGRGTRRKVDLHLTLHTFYSSYCLLPLLSPSLSFPESNSMRRFAATYSPVSVLAEDENR